MRISRLFLCLFLMAAVLISPASAQSTFTGGSLSVDTGSTSGGLAASPYPSVITVPTGAFPSGATVSNVTLTITGLTHNFPNALNVTLVAPNNAGLVVMANVGDWMTGVSNVTVNLSDAHANLMPTYPTQLASGNYKPTARTEDPIQKPGAGLCSPCNEAAPSSTGTFANTFNGVSPFGSWKLYIWDDMAQDVGAISSWSVTITTASAAATSTAVISSSPVSYTGDAVTFTATVTSEGSPVPAQGTVTFREGTTTLAADRPVNGSGQASFSTSSLTEGTHVITAAYSGTASYGPSSGQTTQTVNNHTTNPQPGVFCNPGAITIPKLDQGVAGGDPANPYPSIIEVTGMTGSVSKATVTFNGFTHTYQYHVSMLLAAPDVTRALDLWSNAGAYYDPGAPSVDITLDDAASSWLPVGSRLASGTFKPTANAAGGDSFPTPAPSPFTIASPTGAGTLGLFVGTPPNGTWRLFAVDDTIGDTGVISGGWCLTLETQMLDLSVSKAHSGDFRQGQTGAQYTITVTNNGPGSTTAPVTVTDSLPAGLTATGLAGAGWNCTLATLTCTCSDALAAGGYPITLTVDVDDNAPASVTNQVTVTGGGDNTPANNTASDPTNITPAADLTVAKSPVGTFRQGQPGQYTITVSNVGAGPAVGTVTLYETPSTGITVTAIAGANWNCNLGALTCTRSDALAASQSYEPITVTVDVALDAPNPVYNSATVSGGGDLTSGNNVVSVSTPVTQVASITVGTSPAGLSFAVDGTPYTTAQTFTWDAGSSHTIATTSPQAGAPGTRYVFNNWSDGQAMSHAVTAPAVATTYTAAFDTQHQLTTAASPAAGGTVTPASGGYYDAGSVVDLHAAANPAYVFSSWTGPVASSSSADTTVTVTAPVSVTANFAPRPTVTAFRVLFGSQSFDLPSARNRLPWQITGIQAVFSAPIASGGVNSLTGVTATALNGLGTDTLTWTISPLVQGVFATALASDGPNALMDAAGAPIQPFAQNVKTLYGDFDDDGYVAISDVVGIRNAISGAYNIFADINGSGVVDFDDMMAARTRIGATLP